MTIHKVHRLIAALAMLAAIGCDTNDPGEEPYLRELDQVRTATEQYQDMNAAMTAGYAVKATEHIQGMGIHQLKPDLLDDRFEAERPEILLYIEQPEGVMQLVGVEYAVPVDLDNPASAPEGFTGDTDVWVINEEISLWTLHAWIWRDNPDGVFAPFNPRVH